jgi:hypothetical protein
MYVLSQSPRPTPPPVVSDPAKPVTLMEALIELNKARGVYFLFAQQAFGHVTVNLPALSPNISVEKILTQLLRKTSLYYRKVDNQTFVILDKKARGRLNRNDPAVPQEDSVEISNAVTVATVIPGYIAGRVVAVNGKALQGVSVTVQKTHRGTTTDPGGAFSVNADKEDSLLFSFVGYKTLTLLARKIGSDGVVMEPSNQPLTEVLVTAMGIRKQERALGYSATDLDGSLLHNPGKSTWGMR